MKNFYLIYGTDKTVIKNEIDILKQKLNIEELITYSLNKDNLEDILLDASLVNMFSNKKYILIDDAYIFASGKKDNLNDILEEYLDNYNSDTYIIFVCNTDKIDTRKKITKKIESIGNIIITKSKDINYTKNYINNYLNNVKYKIKDIDYFISKVGNNIDNIKNELDKLIIYTIDKKIIDNKDIDLLVIPNLEDEIFALSDAIIKNDIKKSMDLLYEFINKNYDEMQIIGLLSSQFRFMYQVKRLSNKNYNNDMIMKELNVKSPYRIKITLQNCYYYTEDDLLNYLKSLSILDQKIKLGKIEKNLGLQMFLMNKDYKSDKL